MCVIQLSKYMVLSNALWDCPTGNRLCGTVQAGYVGMSKLVNVNVKLVMSLSNWLCGTVQAD